MRVNHVEKMVKEVKMNKFLFSAFKSQDFVQSQENFAQSHDRVTMTFRNSGCKAHICCSYINKTFFIRKK